VIPVSAIRRHLNYANVVSTLALCIALGMGSAYAASQLAPKSVGERQLRPGAVTADKIRKNAVTAPKLKAEAVKQGKIAGGAIVTEKIAAGAVNAAKIASGAITPEKIPNGSVDGAKIDESSLSQVPSANVANFATLAATANPEAFAKVDGEGTVFPANSKGIGVPDVKKGNQDGIYCIAVPFIPKGAQVTPEYTSNNNVSIFVKFGGTESCPAPQVEVRNYNSGSLLKGPFHILFYR
jgi:hypothetical protein